MSATINRPRLTQFLANVDQEILNMQAGESRFRSGPLHFESGKNSCPAINRLEIFKNDPNKKNLDAFFELATQDFGARFTEYFKGESRAIFKVPLSEVLKRPEKAFDVAVKDAFYDMFRAAQLPITPKQMERIEALSLGLAGVFEKKVTNEVEKQLTALVSNLKAEEADREAEWQAKKEALMVAEIREATKKIVDGIDREIAAHGRNVDND